MLVETAAAGACAAWFMAWAVRGRSSQVFGKSIWRGPRGRRSLAWTFDDGPSETTPELLDLLSRLGIRATFFLSGAAVERLPEVARAVRDAGHEIGSHGYSHAPLYLRSPAFVVAELERAQRAIQAVTGVRPALYRPAYGCRWFGLRAAQSRLGVTTVMWTVLAPDWEWPGGRVAARLAGRASNGAILCLHDGRELAPNAGIGPTLEAVRLSAPELARRGFRFETVSELLGPATAR
ncbi:MAG: polysaccharide deacetylase family protein [Acidobacteria bacterium]|nr:polysaccharide deacetylase family protein [Acidobacteriota bacterium]